MAKNLFVIPNWRAWLAFTHDLAACAVAWLAAFWLRFNLEVPQAFSDTALHSLGWVVPLHAVLFVGFGLYRGLWRFASLIDLKRIIYAVAVGAAIVPATLFMFQIAVPRSVLVISPILLIMMMGGSRLAYRAWREQRLGNLLPEKRRPVLVIGSENAAANLVKELAHSPQWRVVGVLDDDAAKHGRQLHGVNVLGRIDDIASWAQKLEAQHAIIAMPEATHSARRRAVTLARDAALKVLTVPSFDDLMSGKVTVSALRDIELDDLLGRDPVVLDSAGLHGLLGGRTVMVTGAGGSIGSELCRQIARFGPGRLVLFELNEFALYSLEQEFRDRHPDLPLVCAIGDVKDRRRMAQVLTAHRPSVVFHAAAYKHVPLMENDNAWEAMRNNVLGTYVAASAAREHGVGTFVMVSTDKAVNPTNVMGATKRLAEIVCQALQRPSGTRYVMVRFGNVLGSAGSVIPRFRQQIAQGGPVTVTHPEITRYFMSIPEAAQLVLQSALMGAGGEIFVLDMGEPVRIVDLARDLIRLSGYTEEDIRIVYTGLRPGEKLYEELLADEEQTVATPHAKLRIARARAAGAGQLEDVLAWLADDSPRSDDEVRAALARWLPEYRPAPAAREAV
jgi:FlaA1/EpsC-like NDP-sugar epimerase